MADQLKDILDGLQARLEGELRGTRAAIAHPTARGDASEEDWLKVLKNHLPYRYQADRAFVIDAEGNCSDYIDIVVYDRQYSPLLYNQANQRYIAAESVYAVFEVKQDLNREHVQYAGDKAASVRRLRRTSARIPYAAGSYEPRPLPPILAGIIAYKSLWEPPFGPPLKEALQSLPPEGQLNLGCALVNGVFEAIYPEGGDIQITIIEGPHFLVQFLMRLLKNLQELATAPAIDYDAYLTRFLEEDAQQQHTERKM